MLNPTLMQRRETPGRIHRVSPKKIIYIYIITITIIIKNIHFKIYNNILINLNDYFGDIQNPILKTIFKNILNNIAKIITGTTIFKTI